MHGMDVVLEGAERTGKDFGKKEKDFVAKKPI